MTTFRRILVGWDGSASAEAALRLAMTYAAGVKGEVTALWVLDRPIGEDGEQSPTPERRRVLEKFNAVFGAGGAQFHAIVGTTHPAHALNRFARDHGFDLIAVGRHSDDNTGDGDGTVHTLMAHAILPLLVVPAD